MVRLLNAFAANAPEGPMAEAELQDWMGHGTQWHLAERAGAVMGLQWVEPLPGTPRGICGIGTFILRHASEITVGSRLFDRTRQAARAIGCARIRARIDPGNDGALIYYRSRGFERIDVPPGAPAIMIYRL